MEQLRVLLSENAAVSLAIGGLAIGILFGAIVQKTHFCTMGSLSDMVNFEDARRFRSWLLALATAIVGTQLLRVFAVVDLSKSMYLATNFDWLGAAIGGLLFGFGMVFAGGCASRNLVRAGTGDLRSLLVVVIIGFTGYITIGGLLGPWRAALASSTAIDLSGMKMASQSLGAFLAHFTGLDAGRAENVAAIAAAAVLAVATLGNRDFRSSPVHVAAGVGVGLCVVAGWALTGLSWDEMADGAVAPGSLSFVRPTGDALEWMQRFTAGRIPGFGVATVLGTMVGAFLTAAATGRLKLATFFDVSDTLRNLFGAVLMGIGGVVALGCTVGQAVTGASTLALSSFIVFAGLVAGGLAGLKVMERMD